MNAQTQAPTIFSRPDTLGVSWADGSVDEFASIWLYDNAPAHRDPHSGQRLVDIADLPEQPRIRAAAVQNGRIRVEWEGSIEGVWFDLPWLAAQRDRRSYRPEFDARRWLDGAEREAGRDFARASLELLQADRQLQSVWLTRLLQDGIAFLSGVPAAEDALLASMRLVGQVAETNYGRVFDVRSVPQPENLAYSDLGLGLHTDNPYRDPVPGFQALHVLIASPDGGESLFADGFALAEHLRDARSRGLRAARADARAVSLPLAKRRALRGAAADRALVPRRGLRSPLQQPLHRPVASRASRGGAVLCGLPPLRRACCASRASS